MVRVNSSHTVSHERSSLTKHLSLVDPCDDPYLRDPLYAPPERRPPYDDYPEPPFDRRRDRDLLRDDPLDYRRPDDRDFRRGDARGPWPLEDDLPPRDRYLDERELPPRREAFDYNHGGGRREVDDRERGARKPREVVEKPKPKPKVIAIGTLLDSPGREKRPDRVRK